MAQLLLAVGLTVGVVLFSMANTHHVELSYVIGAPVRVRLIFLLAIAFVSGSVSTLLYQLTGRVLQRARERRHRMRLVRREEHFDDDLEAAE